jgi:hypothetical protein
MANTQHLDTPTRTYHLASAHVDFRHIHDMTWAEVHKLRQRLSAIAYYAETRAKIQEVGLLYDVEYNIRFCHDVYVALCGLRPTEHTYLLMRFGYGCSVEQAAQMVKMQVWNVQKQLPRMYANLLRLPSFPTYTPDCIRVV